MLFNKKEELSDIENKVVSELKSLTLDIINAKKNGNLDFSLDLIEALYTLYSRHLKINPANPNYPNRDRLLLSTPTAYPALLATQYMSGYDISLDELRNRNISLGNDMVFNQIGDGLATSIGIAIGEKYLNEKYGNLFDYYTYVIISDLDLIKGTSYSSLTLAGTLNLKKLILLYDNNNEALGKIEKETFNIDINKYFDSLGFDIIDVNKHSVIEIDNAIKKAKDSLKPTIIILNQDNDKYKFENNYVDNDYLLSSDEVSKIKKDLDVRDVAFAISSDAKEEMENMISNRMNVELSKWEKAYNSLDENKYKLFEEIFKNNYSLDDKGINYVYSENDLPEDVVIKILFSLMENNELLLGGLSNFNTLLNQKINTNRIINYGLRENLIGEIQNGLCLSYLNNFSITNFSSANKIIPAILKACSLKLNNLYIFIDEENDIIDGINPDIYDNLNILRGINNLDIYRPNDVNEIIGSFRQILENRNRPSCMIISRRHIDTKEESSIVDVKKGAYIIKNENKDADCILVSSGNDLDMVLDIANDLSEKGYDIRVVSIPSSTLFEKQRKEYKKQLFGDNKTFIIEKSSSNYWYQFIDDDNYILTPDNIEWYKDDSNLEEFKEKIAEYIENLLK